VKRFTYVITSPSGLHARPAGELVKAARALDSAVTVAAQDGRSASGKKLMAVLALGIRQGGMVTVTVEGPAEEADAAALEQFFKENL